MSEEITNENLVDDNFRRYARLTGFAMLLSAIFGFLGESYLPGLITVRGDATATAANILQHTNAIRGAFAAYTIEGICDIVLCVLFCLLLRPVNPKLALISAFLGIPSMVTFAIAQAAFFASSLVLSDSSGMSSFTADQRNAIAFLCIRISGMIGGLFLVYYGLATMLRGYLISRSNYLPRILGIMLMIGGAGFVIRTATYVLSPTLSTPLLLFPMAVGAIALMVWLLLRPPRQTNFA